MKQLLEGLANEEVEDNLRQARQRMKTVYDMGKQDSSVMPGDSGLVKVQILIS